MRGSSMSPNLPPTRKGEKRKLKKLSRIIITILIFYKWKQLENQKKLEMRLKQRE